MKTIVREIAGLLVSMEISKSSSNNELYRGYKNRLLRLIKQTAPSGSGIAATKIDLDSSRNQLVFHVDFHHMNGRSRSAIVVKPDLASDFTLTVKGESGMKDYLAEVYQYWLGSEAP